MGILDFVVNQAKKIIENNNNNNNINNNYRNENYNNNMLVNYQRDKFNKEQVIALFLNSMSYRPHKIGKNNNDDYPGYLSYEYNILDVPSFHKEMIELGYFKTADFKNVISRYKVDEIKALLKDSQEKINKLKKDELINLAVKTLDENHKNKIVEESKMFELSEEGLKYLETYKEFLNIVDLQKYCISFSLFMDYRKKLPSYSTIRDVAWHILNERLNYYQKEQQFGMYRNVFLQMANFLDEEKKSIDALYYYILIMYYDINLAYIQYDMVAYKFDKKIYLDMLHRNILAPAIISKVKEYSDLHDDSIFEKLFRNEVLPYKFLSNEDFKNMIIDIYNNSFFDENKYVDVVLENATNAINKL